MQSNIKIGGHCIIFSFHYNPTNYYNKIFLTQLKDRVTDWVTHHSVEGFGQSGSFIYKPVRQPRSYLANIHITTH